MSLCPRGDVLFDDNLVDDDHGCSSQSDVEPHIPERVMSHLVQQSTKHKKNGQTDVTCSRNNGSNFVMAESLYSDCNDPTIKQNRTGQMVSMRRKLLQNDKQRVSNASNLIQQNSAARKTYKHGVNGDIASDCSGSIDFFHVPRSRQIRGNRADNDFYTDDTEPAMPVLLPQLNKNASGKFQKDRTPFDESRRRTLKSADGVVDRYTQLNQSYQGDQQCGTNKQQRNGHLRKNYQQHVSFPTQMIHYEDAIGLNQPDSTELEKKISLLIRRELGLSTRQIAEETDDRSYASMQYGYPENGLCHTSLSRTDSRNHTQVVDGNKPRRTLVSAPASKDTDVRRMKSVMFDRSRYSDCPSRRRIRRKNDDPSSDDGDHDDSNRDYHRRRGSSKGSKWNREDEHDSDPSSDDESIRVENRRQRRRNNKWIKPDKFDGRGSWETFLLQFQNCAKYNKWNMDDKEAHLRWSMTGMAAQVLWKTDKLDYHQLVNKLSDRFSGRGIEVKYQNELRSRRTW